MSHNVPFPDRDFEYFLEGTETKARCRHCGEELQTCYTDDHKSVCPAREHASHFDDDTKIALVKERVETLALELQPEMLVVTWPQVARTALTLVLEDARRGRTLSMSFDRRTMQGIADNDPSVVGEVSKRLRALLGN